MTEGGGTFILAGEGSVRGPGHNSILTEGDRQYIVFHYYDADDHGRSKLGIRPLTWTAEGWPEVSRADHSERERTAVSREDAENAE
jgi:arabinan endo-1,5-alpha-L-arabinosidase